MSNNNAAATRKRRSSILKTKPRAPLSELEFNPATPEAATKSRRVSFCRKKDVAEFVVNDATTTWRNFYEEQNGTLESSGNDSEIRPSAVKQFHEVEAEIDHTTLGNPVGSRANLTLFSDMDFTEQLAQLDCMTADNCFKAPTQKLDPSMMVEKSKVFGDSFSNPRVTGHPAGVELDFSAMQRGVEEQNISDIVKEIELSHPQTARQNSILRDFNNISCYVEVDLNETKGVGRNDISDMSITDTISPPLIDKENIAIDSYQSNLDKSILIFDGKKLKTANIHDKLDDVIDDSQPIKKLNSACAKIISDSNKLDVGLDISIIRCNSYAANKENYSEKENIVQPTKAELQHANRQTLALHQMSMMMDLSNDNFLENASINLAENILGMPSLIEQSLGSFKEKQQLSNTAVICSDLLENTKTQNPNMSSSSNSYSQHKNPSNEPGTAEKYKKNHCNPGNHKEIVKNKSIILNQDDDLPNFTSDVPPRLGKSIMKEKKSIIFDTEDSVCSMSTTQGILNELSNIYIDKNTKKTNESIFTNNDISLGDISMTIGVPIASHIIEKKSSIFLTENNMTCNMDLIGPDFKSEAKRKTLIFDADDDLANISLTQAIQTNIKRKTLNVMVDMSMTQAIPQSILNENHKKRHTIVFDAHDDLADLSMTQAVPTAKCVSQEIRKIVCDGADFPITQTAPQIFSDKVDCIVNIPTRATPETGEKVIHSNIDQYKEITHQRKSIICSNKFNNDVTSSLSTSVTSEEQLNPVEHGKSDSIAYMPINEAVTPHVVIHQKGMGKSPSQRMTTAQKYEFNKDLEQNNMTDPNLIMPTDINIYIDKNTKKTNESIFTNNDISLGDISMTIGVPIASHIIEKKSSIFLTENNMTCNMDLIGPDFKSEAKRKTLIFDADDDLANISLTQAIQTNIKRKTLNVMVDMSMTQAIPQSILNENHKKRHTIVFDAHDDLADLSMTQAVPTAKCVSQEIRKIVCDGADFPITQTAPQIFSDKVDCIVNIPTRATPETGEKVIHSNIDQYKEITHQRKSIICSNKFNNDVTSSLSTSVTSEEQLNPVEHGKSDSIAYMPINEAVTPHVVIHQKGMGKSPSQRMTTAQKYEFNKDLEQNNMTDPNLIMPTDSNVQLDRLFGDSLKTVDFQDSTCNKDTVHLIKEKRKTLPSQIEDLSNLESDFAPKVILKNLSGRNSKKEDTSESRNINKTDSQSLQVLRHDVENGMVKGAVEEHIMRNSVITSVCTDIPVLNKDNFSVEEQSSKGQFEKSLRSSTNNMITEIDHQQINKTNEIIDLLTVEIEKNILTSVNEVGSLTQVVTDSGLVKTNETTERDHKEVTKKVKENIIKKQLTIPDLLNQTERIKSMNITVNLENKQMSSSNRTKHDNSEGIQCNKMQKSQNGSFEINPDTRNKTLRLSKEVVKTLNFEDENIDRQENIYRKDNIRSSLVKKSNVSVDVSTKLNMSNPRAIPEAYDTTLNSINDLMKELVKPNIDLPFNFNKEKNTLFNDKESTSDKPHTNTIIKNDKQDHNSVTAGDVVDTLHNVDGMVIPISPNKFTKQSPLRQMCRKKPIPVTNISDEVTHVPELTDNRKSIIFDHSNPLNNVDLNSMTHNNAHAPLQNYRKFDVSNPLNNICFNAHTLVPKAKSLSLDDGLKSDVERVCTSTKEIINNNELVENTSCITLIDDTLDTNSSDEQLDMVNNSDILSTNTSLPRTKTMLRQQNIDVLYVMGKEKCDIEATNEGSNTYEKEKVQRTTYEGGKTDQTGMVQGKEIASVLVEKINEILKVPSPRQHSDASMSDEKYNDKELSDGVKIDECSKINKTQNDEKYNEKEIIKKESKFIDKKFDESKCDFNTKQSNEKSITDYRNKTDQNCMENKLHSRKRVLSPKKLIHNYCKLNNLELTPNPPRKIHKISYSPHLSCDAKKKDSAINSAATDIKNSQSVQGTIITEIAIPDKALMPKRQNSYVIDNELLDNEKSIINEEADMSPNQSMMGECVWQKENLDVQEELVDIAEMIDKLPFLGTWCCEWERAEREAWSFLMLHARVRVRVQFAREESDPRVFVPSDTPITAVNVEALNEERGHAVAALCVRACVAALRTAVAEGGSACAADAPALLERCAPVVRSAARFGRVMQDASLHLAFRLKDDAITLQVVNIPLRSMWDVSLRVTLSGAPARPRAVDVRVAPALASECAPLSLDALLADSPDGWEHLPYTIWKVFRYLKNMRKEDFCPLTSKR